MENTSSPSPTETDIAARSKAASKRLRELREIRCKASKQLRQSREKNHKDSVEERILEIDAKKMITLS